MTEKNYYYMPQGDHEFLLWARNFTDVAGRNAKAWGLVQTDIDDLKTATENYAHVLQIADSRRASKEDIQLKNTFRTALASKFKDYVDAEIRCNKAVDAGGRAALEVYIPDEPVPADASPFQERDLFIPAPHVRAFLPSEQGKQVCCAGGWQNGKGEKEPMSGIQAHIVP
jgi:hypothetical protein